MLVRGRLDGGRLCVCGWEGGFVVVVVVILSVDIRLTEWRVDGKKNDC